MLLAIFYIIAILLLFPDVALAWGPGAHLEVGSLVLSNMALLAPVIQRLLSKYSDDYLYGCISADTTVGKKFTSYINHCHNWQVAMELIRNAETDSEMAFSYGYLSHLAADIVAHNYYIPNQMITSFRTKTLKHMYWEMRFETHIDKEIWNLARKIAKKTFKSNDELMERTLKRTLFSFKTNKRIFSASLLLSRLEQWQRLVENIGQQSKYTLTRQDAQPYIDLSLDYTFDFLINLENSEAFKLDPAGLSTLKSASSIRRNLKKIDRSGFLMQETVDVILKEMEPPPLQGSRSYKPLDRLFLMTI